ncbi:hypothetical protein B4133_0756 [Bacillus altitudinis]|nr:hypothetical protein B4133_0756 [Bacillus altitudinis]
MLFDLENDGLMAVKSKRGNIDEKNDVAHIFGCIQFQRISTTR